MQNKSCSPNWFQSGWGLLESVARVQHEQFSSKIWEGIQSANGPKMAVPGRTYSRHTYIIHTTSYHTHAYMSHGAPTMTVALASLYPINPFRNAAKHNAAENTHMPESSSGPVGIKWSKVKSLPRWATSSRYAHLCLQHSGHAAFHWTLVRCALQAVTAGTKTTGKCQI